MRVRPGPGKEDANPGGEVDPGRGGAGGKGQLERDVGKKEREIEGQICASVIEARVRKQGTYMVNR